MSSPKDFKNDIEMPLLDRTRRGSSSTKTASNYLEIVAKEIDTPDKYISDYSLLEYAFFFDAYPGVKRINDAGSAPIEIKDLPLPYKHYNIIAKIATLDKEWQDELQTGTPSLLKALYRTYKEEFYKSGLMMFAVFLSRIYSTLLLGRTIGYISAAAMNQTLDRTGIITEAAMFAIIFLATNIFNSHYWNYVMVLAARIRLSIVGILYKKLNGVALSSVQEINIGKVINLLANDLNDIDGGFVLLWPVILSPVNLLITGWLMWEYFEYYTILSILGLVGAVFASQYISKLTKDPRVKKNAITDERIKGTNEIIECIRLIKMYAWEKSFKAVLETLREKEFGFMFLLTKIEVFGQAISEQAALFSAFIMFSIYTTVGQGVLTPEKVYAFLMVLGFVRMWCIQFPHMGRVFTVNAQTIQKRVEDILNIPNIASLDLPNAVNPRKRSDKGQHKVTFKNFTAYWNSKESKPKECLKDLNLAFNSGQVTAVIGKVGAGKTSLFLAIMKEISKYNGEMVCDGTVAYVEQEPIIFSGTVRDNILFGFEFDEDLYHDVVEACCLKDDFKQLAQEDMTMIGEKGVTLSGGQKARISLARAVYSRSDIYLLDDPVSAVDSKVARNLFNRAIRGELLRNKVVILATHHISFAQECDRIILLNEGAVAADGEPQVLRNQNIPFLKDLLDDTQFKMQAETEQIARKSTIASASTAVEENLAKDYKEEITIVSWNTYYEYLRSSGNLLYLIGLVFIFIGQYVALIYYNRFMGYWAYQEQEYANINGGSIAGFNHAYYIGLGFLITITYFGMRYFRTVLAGKFFMQTNSRLHAIMLRKIIRAPIRFFDKTPVGSILNRFSNDLGQLDKVNWGALVDVFGGAIGITVLTITVVSLNFYVIIPVLLVGFGLRRFRDFFAKPTGETKRLDLVSRSPMYSDISSTIHGLLIVRVFRQGGRFIQRFLNLIHNNSRAMGFQQRVQRLFGMLLDLWLYALTVSGIFLYIYISFSSLIDPGLFGFALSLLLEISNQSGYFIKQSLVVDVSMQSCERVLRYTKLEEEAEDSIPSTDNQLKPPSRSWPERGEIIFRNVYMKYAPEFPFVLNGLSFHIKAGEKIGVVGRTGAGKSSIIQVLFRMFEIDPKYESEILIDGVNIRRIGLDILRKNLGIIPQIAAIFAGTIRRNLDPLGEYNEDELWQCLEDVDLRQYVEKLEKKLDTDMTISTSVFSAGQKQLICLARSILRKSQIIMLDEATANVDHGTDKLIQDKIGEKFRECTVITVAHRLTTIANYDRILVMDKGRVAEFDSPYRLLVEEEGDKEMTRKGGLFYSMVQNTGKDASKIFEIAYAKWNNKSRMTI